MTLDTIDRPKGPRMSSRRRPIIMCGGAGTRLGPISHNSLPKQLGERSTFQDTVLMLRHTLFERPIVLTNRDYRVLAEKQLAEIDAEADIVMEPERRENGGIEPLELIGVQNGSDLGEGDAIRADEIGRRL